MTHSKIYDIDMRLVLQSDKDERKIEEAVERLFEKLIRPLGSHGLVVVDLSSWEVNETAGIYALSEDDLGE